MKVLTLNPGHKKINDQINGQHLTGVVWQCAEMFLIATNVKTCGKNIS